MSGMRQACIAGVVQVRERTVDRYGHPVGDET
jgi:hypothetical protein